MAKLARLEPIPVHRPTDPQVRASAGRIVDILQQLVIARPDMVIPVEEIVRGILVSRRVSLVEKMWEREDERRPRRGTPLPEVPLSELPAMLALLERPAAGPAEKPRRTKAHKQKRR